MSLRRIGILFLKEIAQGLKNYIAIMALVVPVAMTLLVTLVFGSYFSGQPRLGLTDQGQSAMPGMARENSAILVRSFSSDQELKDAVERGAVDVGLVLPANFDQQLRSSETTNLVVYAWGESQMRHRIVVSAAVMQMIRQTAGHDSPVEIVQTVLGSGINIPWEKRLLPLMVLMTVMLSGVLVPSASLVNEKTRRTLSALAVSPATLLDVFAAKGLLGVVLGMISALLILFLNRAFGGQPLLLVLALLMATIFASALGVIWGTLVKDISTLFATIKSMGIILYAPGFIQMFPDLPQWISRLFPTYYALQPVLDISQNNAGLSDVWPNLAILAGLTVVAFAVLVWLARRTQESEAAA
jgi:ABC-2 type transport system permease protein